jgi:hypothetical protein
VVPDALLHAAEVLVCVRPEHVLLGRAGGADQAGLGRLIAVSFGGAVVRARIATSSGEIVADVPTHEWQELGIRQGDAVSWRVRQGAPIVLPIGGG